MTGRARWLFTQRCGLGTTAEARPFFRGNDLIGGIARFPLCRLLLGVSMPGAAYRLIGQCPPG
jgi:hypothetical protein